MQGWEGEMDTVHAAFLHYGAAKSEDYEPGTLQLLPVQDPLAPLQRDRHRRSARRTAPTARQRKTRYYWRTAHMMFPFYAVIPAGWLGMYVPMDDEHTMHWEILVRPQSEGKNAGITVGPGSVPTTGGTHGGTTWLPNGTGWYDRFNIDQTKANDYLIDREAQKE